MMDRRQFLIAGAAAAVSGPLFGKDGVAPTVDVAASTPEKVGPRVPVGPQDAPEIPAGAITVRTTDAIQAKLNAAGEGAVFVLDAGTHTPGGSITPRNRQQLWGNLGTIIDGKGQKQAFNCANRSGVLLKNFAVRNYKPLGDAPAIEGGQSAWGTAENLEISGIDGCGIRVSTMRGCWLHDITVVGYSMYYQQVSAATIEDCVIERINAAKKLTGREGGGKAWSCVTPTIRHCRFSEIYGNCAWFDFNNDLVVVEYCDFKGGVGHGVFLEIGYRAQVRYNSFSGVRNKGTQGGDQRAAVAIVKTQGVKGSTGAEVYRNTISDCSIGVGIFEEAKETGQSPRYDVWQTRNAWVHDNTMTACDVFSGFWNWGGNPLESGDNNRFDLNTYRQPRTAKPFWVMTGSLTWPQWRAKGFDANGTMN